MPDQEPYHPLYSAHPVNRFRAVLRQNVPELNVQICYRIGSRITEKAYAVLVDFDMIRCRSRKAHPVTQR